MTMKTMPVDLYMKHESEWQAVRAMAARDAEAGAQDLRAGARVEVGKRIGAETPSAG